MSHFRPTKQEAWDQIEGLDVPVKKDDCDPKEKEAERFNNPVDQDLQLIQNAIKMGKNVNNIGGKNPYLESLGESLNGACHLGEIPNPSDIMNPLAPADPMNPAINGLDTRNQ